MNCEHNLEVIAKTQPDARFQAGAEVEMTFSRCTKCDQLYEQLGGEGFIFADDKPKQYKGSLDATKIQTYVPQITGLLSRLDETKITEGYYIN